MTQFNIYTLDEHPSFRAEIDRISAEAWVPFMHHHKVIKPQWPLLFERFPRYQFTIFEGKNCVAIGNTVPIFWDGTLENLPAGWDAAFAQGFVDQDDGKTPTVLSAVSVGVTPAQRRRGFGKMLLETMKYLARKNNLPLGLIATVRPTGKSKYPLIPFEDYVQWKNDDGLTFDPWLGLHEDMGAQRLRIEPQSKTIMGSVKQWAAWTDLRFPQDGDYIVRNALVPVMVKDGKGLYIEPNIWMHHKFE
ncbi:MAG: GNAT family N-acetyltransferase [Chloroflexi bacterium]|nr:GNAT family N-acetyltransferase [Chloroflexota bacterium]